MCDSLQICLIGAASTNILTPYDIKTAFAGKSSKYCVKFLQNWVLQKYVFATPPVNVIERITIDLLSTVIRFNPLYLELRRHYSLALAFLYAAFILLTRYIPFQFVSRRRRKDSPVLHKLVLYGVYQSPETGLDNVRRNTDSGPDRLSIGTLN